MKDIKRTLLSISPIRLNRKLGKVATALLFTAAVTTCSLTMWASPSSEWESTGYWRKPTMHSNWRNREHRPIPLAQQNPRSLRRSIRITR